MVIGHTPWVNHSFLPRAVNRLSHRTAVHTATQSHSNSWGDSETLTGSVTEGLGGALPRWGPFSWIFKRTTQLPVFHCPQRILHYLGSELPAPRGSIWTLSPGIIGVIRNCRLLLLPIWRQVLWFIYRCTFLQLAQHLTHRRCWIPGSKWWKNVIWKVNLMPPQGCIQVRGEVRFRPPVFCPLISTLIPDLTHHRHLRSVPD